ncbi:hypothetical protein [Lysobacter sp. GCM10012299]|uniref:hypothetical protein n=1 Tax=Lysobacter sp. GCM10012299 TaxID=3317333 RepID=UPI00360AF85E
MGEPLSDFSMHSPANELSLYLFFTPAGVLLSKRSYAFPASLLRDASAAEFLGPLSGKQAIDYLNAAFPDLRTPARVQIEAFLATPEIIQLLSD